MPRPPRREIETESSPDVLSPADLAGQYCQYLGHSVCDADTAGPPQQLGRETVLGSKRGRSYGDQGLKTVTDEIFRRMEYLLHSNVDGHSVYSSRGVVNV